MPIALLWGCCQVCPAETTQAQKENPTILFVDDDPFQALVYTGALEGRFHPVRRVADAVQALCLIEDPRESRNLDLVISAHHWAGVSGPEFVAELHRRLPAIPVLVLGTDEDLLDDYPAFEGQVSFLRTPVTAQRLVETVGSILARGYRNVA